jgi:16S rRNA (cytidine1402-2'-O)-methyltransferase
MQAFHEHNESAKTADIVAQLLAGKNIALISDAGTTRTYPTKLFN